MALGNGIGLTVLAAVGWGMTEIEQQREHLKATKQV